MEGSIQTRSWDDNDGNKRYATEVVVDHAEFCERRGEPQLTPENANADGKMLSSPTGNIWSVVEISDFANNAHGKTSQENERSDVRLADVDGNGFIPTDYDEDLPF